MEYNGIKWDITGFYLTNPCLGAAAVVPGVWGLCVWKSLLFSVPSEAWGGTRAFTTEWSLFWYEVLLDYNKLLFLDTNT